MTEKNEIKAIETAYKGYRFRSRLEARWAVFFDSLGKKWEYEPEGFYLKAGMYLPDFHVEHIGYCEVKPNLESLSQTEINKLVEFDIEKGLWVLDGTPDFRVYMRAHEICMPESAKYDDPLPYPYTVQPHAKQHVRFGVIFDSYKNRMWWDHHENIFDDPYGDIMGEKLPAAIKAARSARFEHGETPA